MSYRKIICGNTFASMISFTFKTELLYYAWRVQRILITQIICINEPRKYVLSKYCKLNVATIEVCINCMLKFTLVGNKGGIFQDICTSCFTVYSSHFTIPFARFSSRERAPCFIVIIVFVCSSLRLFYISALHFVLNRDTCR